MKEKEIIQRKELDPIAEYYRLTDIINAKEEEARKARLERVRKYVENPEIGYHLSKEQNEEVCKIKRDSIIPEPVKNYLIELAKKQYKGIDTISVFPAFEHHVDLSFHFYGVEGINWWQGIAHYDTTSQRFELYNLYYMSMAPTAWDRLPAHIKRATKVLKL